MYEKINFKDRIVEKPNTYTVQTNDDGTVTLVPAFGNVLQEGTIINSKNMDHIEEALISLNNNKQNNVLSGIDAPNSSLGEDGDVYFQYS